MWIKKTDFIVRDIDRYFSFLYGKGFTIRSVDYSPHFNGSWVVEFESNYCLIYITKDRNSIILEFSPVRNQDVRNRITLEKIIYLITKGQTVIEPFEGNLAWGKNKQLKRLSNILEKYIDRISLCFNNEVGKFLLPN